MRFDYPEEHLYLAHSLKLEEDWHYLCILDDCFVGHPEDDSLSKLVEAIAAISPEVVV